jgi:hypothetical protein
MAESPGGVDRFMGFFEGVSGVVGGLVVLGVAVAAMRVGGVAGWAVGGSLLGLLLVGATVGFLRRD